MAYSPNTLMKSIESFCNREGVTRDDLRKELAKCELSYEHFIGFYKYYAYAIYDTNRISQVRNLLIERIKLMQWGVSDCVKMYKEAFLPIANDDSVDTRLERAALYILKKKVDFTLDDYDKIFWILEGWTLDELTFFKYLSKQYRILDKVVMANDVLRSKKLAGIRRITRECVSVGKRKI